MTISVEAFGKVWEVEDDTVAITIDAIPTHIVQRYSNLSEYIYQRDRSAAQDKCWYGKYTTLGKLSQEEFKEYFNE